MEVKVGPRGVLRIDDARITFRNFAGRPDMYNREGDRNFAWVIPDRELADKLAADGWNVKIKPPRNEGDDEFIYMNVKVRFNDRGPEVYLRSGNNTRELTEESVGLLDSADILRVDMDIRPYDWTNARGESGRSAYLNGIWVEQDRSRFADRFAEEEFPGEDTPW